jgi:hypothetical protein
MNSVLMVVHDEVVVVVALVVVVPVVGCVLLVEPVVVPPVIVPLVPVDVPVVLPVGVPVEAPVPVVLPVVAPVVPPVAVGSKVALKPESVTLSDESPQAHKASANTINPTVVLISATSRTSLAPAQDRAVQAASNAAW